jgi:hypothetical protein
MMRAAARAYTRAEVTRIEVGLGWSRVKKKNESRGDGRSERRSEG